MPSDDAGRQAVAAHHGAGRPRRAGDRSHVGVVAAAYRDGVIVLVVPELPSRAAVQLGEALRASVSKLRLANPEAIAADHVTASVAVVTGMVSRGSTASIF